MSSTNITTPLVQPSQNDLNGGVANDGKRALEKYIRELHKAINPESYIVSGGLLPTSAANLILIVPAGVAYISGYYVTWAATNVTLPASSTSHIFVKLIFSSGLVSNVQIEDNTSGTAPSDSVKLGTVVTGGSTITGSTDQRLFSTRVRRDVISASGTTNWPVPANVTKIRIRQWAPGGGGGGGGGGEGSFGGGAGVAGERGGYVEAVVSVTPGATVTIVNGAPGPGGAGGAFNVSGGGDGTAGTAGGNSSVSGTGFNFSANGGPGGPAGKGAPSGGPAGSNASYSPNPGTATQSSGTADVLSHGGGRSGGTGGAGGGPTGNGVAGTSGQSGVTVIDY